jgi:hypothetical protein
MILAKELQVLKDLHDDRSSFTCAAIITLNISMALKSPTVTWQGTHYEFMKLMTSANVSRPDLDIHKSNEIIAVTHESKTNITDCSVVLTTNEGMACLTICFRFKTQFMDFVA